MIQKAYKVRLAGPGPSLQVCLPPLWTASHGIKAGDHIMVVIETDRLIVKPMGKKVVENEAND